MWSHATTPIRCWLHLCDKIEAFCIQECPNRLSRRGDMILCFEAANISVPNPVRFAVYNLDWGLNARLWGPHFARGDCGSRSLSSLGLVRPVLVHFLILVPLFIDSESVIYEQFSSRR